MAHGPPGVEVGEGEVLDGHVEKDGRDREEEEARCGDGRQGGEIWGRGEVGRRRRREGIVLVVHRRRGALRRRRVPRAWRWVVARAGCSLLRPAARASSVAGRNMLIPAY